MEMRPQQVWLLARPVACFSVPSVPSKVSSALIRYPLISCVEIAMNMFVVEEFMKFRFPTAMNQVQYTQFGTNMNGNMMLSSAGAKILFRVNEKILHL
jgi:hypothetical protein